MKKPPLPGRYIDPLLDFSFKLLFGSPPTKDLLIAFLNELLLGELVITDLEYGKNEHPGELKEEGGVIFDLHCTDTTGNNFLIEVQRIRQDNFENRVFYYAARLISDQIPKGNRLAWNYEMKPTIVVAILEHSLPENAGNAHFIDELLLVRKSTGKISNKLTFKFIELAKFDKGLSDLRNSLDKWIYALKHMRDLKSLPAEFTEPVFKKLFDTAEYTNLTKEDKTMYDSSLKFKWDLENSKNYEKRLSREEGRAEGVELGMEKGEKSKALAIARKLKLMGLSPAEISEIAGLTEAEIDGL